MTDDVGVRGAGPDSVAAQRVLDNPTWAALTGPHARFALRFGRAARYQPDVSPFVAVADPGDEGAWADLAHLVAPGETVPLIPLDAPPAGWEVVRRFEAVQLVGTALRAEPDDEARPLGPADLPEMLDLVERTEPGPFLPRTPELGTYLGIRRGGALIAMAGERMHLPGWTEISAVCTDPAFRGMGLATRLVRAVAAGIHARGETAFLHAAATNTGAIRLYESIGCPVRLRSSFLLVRLSAAATQRSGWRPEQHRRPATVHRSADRLTEAVRGSGAGGRCTVEGP